MWKQFLFLLVFSVGIPSACWADTPVATVSSPNEKNSISIYHDGEQEGLTYDVHRNGRTILEKSALHLTLAKFGDLAQSSRITSTEADEVDESITPAWGKAKHIDNTYSSGKLELESATGVKWELEIRAYDDAVAFRYVIPKQAKLDHVAIESEKTEFRLAGNPTMLYMVCESVATNFEGLYKTAPLADLPTGALLGQPLLATWPDGSAAAISEARLRHYAGMFLVRGGGDKTLLHARHATLPGKAPTIVESNTPVESPWRVIMLADKAGKLLESNVHVCLNDPPSGDFRWFEPGKTTWHWWNGTADEGLGFPAGMNFQTHKRYIDFCAEHGIKYHAVVADNRPWYVQSKDGYFPGPDTDILTPRPELDLPRILEYAKSRGIGIRLWVHWKPLNARLDEAFATYHQWGVKGLMIDFLDRNDQEMVEFSDRVLKAAQKYQLNIQFHGSYPPTGEEYTFPNLVNREGVLNLEYAKWTRKCNPEHDVQVAYTRALAGPTDYHLGGFRSAARSSFKPHAVSPNVLGTRCHHLALYVIFENPLPMVSDVPSAYENQPGFDFIEQVPTTWDATRFLAGEAGEYVAVARRKGKDWYLGGITNWTAREVRIPLDFLESNTAEMTLYRDAANSSEQPNHLEIEQRKVRKDESLLIRLAEGGGFAAVIRSD
jgi:alpha-glucosidase